MDIVLHPTDAEVKRLCRRNRADDDAKVTQAVEAIIADVADRGDQALRDYALKYDGVNLDSVRIDKPQLSEIAAGTSQQVREAIEIAKRNIQKFHKAQRMDDIVVDMSDGNIVCRQAQVPIDSVGLYVPGGQAPLFSTVLMLALPAQIARCRQVVLCTPYVAGRGISPELAYTALQCGLESIYAVGGAQAIAAMAYGTETIPAVDKIFGPGNRYVTKAKQLVSSRVAIDMLAGPSEVMVLADSTACARYIAADLLSQAEHGPDSQALLVTTSEDIARQVMAEVDRQKQKLSRKDSVEGSLSASHLVVVDSVEQMVEIANTYAPEHLIIATTEPWDVAHMIRSAGSIFVGSYSPESAGDYASGTNHTLPTSGLARAYSGVNIDSFMKKITYQEITPAGLRHLSSAIIPMAEAEGLEAHAAAVKIRLDEEP